MKKDEKKKSGFLGPLGKELVETKPVGGRIPKEKMFLWNSFRSECCIAGMQVSPDGMLDMVETYTKINMVVFPMAKAYGFKPKEFKNAVLDIILNSLKELNKEKWVKDSDRLKENIRKEIKEIVKVSIQ